LSFSALFFVKGLGGRRLLNVVETTRAGVQVLSFAGKIDARTLGEFEAGIQDVVTRGDARLVLDLSDVPFISSAGFGVLMSVIDGIREQGGDLKIAAVPSEVYRIFELLEFNQVFEFYDGIEQAVAAFDA